MITLWFKSSQGLSRSDESEDSTVSTAVENPAFPLVLTQLLLERTKELEEKLLLITNKSL